jgi:hypothetical protein
MNRMKVRFDIQDMGLKISNVTHPRAEDSYVLIKVSDQINNEIVIELSHEQAEYLENELYEANRRWKATANTPNIEDNDNEQSIDNNEEQDSGFRDLTVSPGSPILQ